MSKEIPSKRLVRFLMHCPNRVRNLISISRFQKSPLKKARGAFLDLEAMDFVCPVNHLFLEVTEDEEKSTMKK